MKKFIDSQLSLFNNNKYLISLDIARIVAVLLILLMHIESGFNSYTGNKLINFIYIGPYGVPIFFFISGFLIFRSLERKKQSIFTFWYNRTAALIPLYYSLLFIYIVSIFIFSNYLNNFQEVSLSKVISSLFFGFGRMELTYLSASWTMWPIFVFYTYASLILIKVPKNYFIRLLIGSALISGSYLFPGAGLFGEYSLAGVPEINSWTIGTTSGGILLTCIGNFASILGSYYIFTFLKIFTPIIVKSKFIFKRDNIFILGLFLLSSFYYFKGSNYFYFSAGAFLFYVFNLKKYSYLLAHFVVLLICSLISLRNNNYAFLIYFLFIFTPFLEDIALNLNEIIKKIINLLSKISYSIYLVQIFSIPLFFKISFIFWNKDLVYWKSLIGCLLFTIIISFVVWNILEQPLNQIFSSMKKRNINI